MDELIVGTYEGFVLGYALKYEGKNTKLEQTFATHSHTSAVRSIDISGKFLASGGTDDKVVLVDMKTRKEHNILMQHDGTVDCVRFTNGGTHLVSAGVDGLIILHRVGNWQIEKKWKKAHGGSPVTGIAVHPSDKLLLSIGGDKTLKTWNLVKGRSAFTINLSSKGVTMPTDIAWSPDGDRFSIISLQNVDIWTISKSGLEKRISCNSKPICCAWINDGKVIIGLDNGNILLLTLEHMKAQTIHAHSQRVKCLLYKNETLYTASSGGEIKMWSLEEDNTMKEVCTANCGCRITCLTLNHQSYVVKKEEKVTVSTEETKIEESSEDDDYPHKKKESTSSVSIPRAYVSITQDNKAGEPSKKKFKKGKTKNKNN